MTLCKHVWKQVPAAMPHCELGVTSTQSLMPACRVRATGTCVLPSLPRLISVMLTAGRRAAGDRARAGAPVGHAGAARGAGLGGGPPAVPGRLPLLRHPPAVRALVSEVPAVHLPASVLLPVAAWPLRMRLASTGMVS